jgi:hypothetical protein
MTPCHFIPQELSLIFLFRGERVNELVDKGAKLQGGGKDDFHGIPLISSGGTNH